MCLASCYDQIKDKTASVKQTMSATVATILNLIATVTCPWIKKKVWTTAWVSHRPYAMRYVRCVCMLQYSTDRSSFTFKRAWFDGWRRFGLWKGLQHFISCVCSFRQVIASVLAVEECLFYTELLAIHCFLLETTKLLAQNLIEIPM